MQIYGLHQCKKKMLWSIKNDQRVTFRESLEYLDNADKCGLHHQNTFSEDWDGMSEFSYLSNEERHRVTLFIIIYK